MGGMGSVLETFFIMFQTNADEVVAGNKKVEASGKKLQDALEGTDARTQAVGKGFLRMAGYVTTAAAALVSFSSIMGAIIESAKFADELNNTSNALGINIEQLSMWSDAVEASGGTAGAFQSSLQGMASDFSSLATTGKSKLLPFFKELGIQVLDSKGKVRGVLDVLPEMADSFAKLSKQEALGLGQKLGLDQGTIMLLQQGRREVDAVLARQRELGVVTQKQADMAKRYNDALKDNAHLYRTISLEIGSFVLPAFSWLLEKTQAFIGFIMDHKDFVVGFFIALGGAIMAYAVPAFLTLMAATIGVWGPIALVVGIVAALATGFALLYEDVMTFVNGGDSLIGRMLDWLNSFEEFRAVIKALGEAFDWLSDKAGKLWGWLTKVDGVDLTADVKKSLAISQGQMQAAATSPLASTSSGAITAGAVSNSRTNTVTVGEVNVHTQATDAEGIAGAITGHMGQQLRQAQQNYDNGVAA